MSLTIFICNPHQALEQQLIQESIEEEKRWELELDLARELELAEPLESELPPETIPWSAICDWDVYREF